MNEPLLEVNSLTLDYLLAGRKMRALDKVSFSLEKGQVMGVAGESGCGKSTMGLSIMGLLPQIARISRGEIVFDGEDLLRKTPNEMDKHIRGQKISMIFQNPQNALNPVFKIGTQMTDFDKAPLLKHLMWGGFITTMGLSLVPLIQMAGLPIIYDAVFATGTSMAALGLVAYNSPSEQFLHWGGALGIGLGAMIGIGFLQMFWPSKALFNIWLYGGVGLFGAFILYDT